MVKNFHSIITKTSISTIYSSQYIPDNNYVKAVPKFNNHYVNESDKYKNINNKYE